MSEHCGYVVSIDQLRPHSNSSHGLQIATIFGNDTIVDKTVHVGDIGIYFPVDLQLSVAYCNVNNLVRRKDANGNEVGGYLDPNKRNIKAVRLRGEMSDGIYMPIVSLAEFCDVSTLKVGQTIDVVNGHEICRKYVPAAKKPSTTTRGSRSAKQEDKSTLVPTFYEHVDTAQLAYNLHAFKRGDDIQVTLKMHGTSQRTGYLPIIKPVKQTWWQRLIHGVANPESEPGFVTGTRHKVLLGDDLNTDEEWRYAMANKFFGKLHKGETVYYEVVGFQGKGGAPIMASCDNHKLKDSDFIRRYGDTTVFSYGCDPNGDYMACPMETLANETFYIPPCCDTYVYRMTMTNEDGDSVDYSPAQIAMRCEQMGVNHVIELDHFIIPNDCAEPGRYVYDRVMQYVDGPDPIDCKHVREGVVVRILNRDGFAVYKHKNFSFKVLEGIIKESVVADGMDSDIVEEL